MEKTGSNQYSTDDEKLTELSEEFEVVHDIQEYRKLAKLKSTYVDSLPLMINLKQEEFIAHLIKQGQQQED